LRAGGAGVEQVGHPGLRTAAPTTHQQHRHGQEPAEPAVPVRARRGTFKEGGHGGNPFPEPGAFRDGAGERTVAGVAVPSKASFRQRNTGVGGDTLRVPFSSAWRFLGSKPTRQHARSGSSAGSG
jgi:hypothetical protein